MGYFKIRRSLAIAGGSVNIGADTNLYRNSANVLKTDDALTVTGALTASALITASIGVDAAGGTKLTVPYATATPNINANGQLQMLQKANRSYLLYYAGGTPCYIALPQVSEGTALFTVGGTP